MAQLMEAFAILQRTVFDDGLSAILFATLQLI